MSAKTVTLGQEGALTIADIEAVALGQAVALAPDAKARLAAFRCSMVRDEAIGCTLPG